MKKLIKEINEYTTLYRDDTTGIAWIEDGGTGLGISVHPNISNTGSVRGMKDRGYWGRKDRTVRSHGWIYNIDRLVVNNNNPLEKLLADTECKCQACIERREGIYERSKRV